MSYMERLKVVTDALWNGCLNEGSGSAWVSIVGSTNLTWLECETLAAHVLSKLDRPAEKGALMSNQPDMLATGDRVHLKGDHKDTGVIARCLLNGTYRVTFDDGGEDDLYRSELVKLDD